MVLTVASRLDAPVSGVDDLVDLERYPLDEPQRASALAEDCARRFAKDGVCLLPGFLRDPALARAARETRAHLGDAFFCRNTHNAYLAPHPDSDFPEHHPRNRRLRTEVGSIPNDRVPRDGALSRLYAWDPLTGFIAGVTGEPVLHRSADPLGALSINVFEPGGGHGWHFDEARFSVTLMLSTAERGGHFEYVAGARSERDEGYELVARILDGETAPVRMPFEPGTLSIFAGHLTLHRVTRVEGRRHRLVAVLSYNREPGIGNSEEVRRLFWGRAA